MTLNKRYIELGDIISLRIQCKECSVVFEGTLEVLEKRLGHTLQGCPGGCGKTWNDPEVTTRQGQQVIMAKELVRSLMTFRESMAKQPYSVLLEIKQDESKKAG